MTDLAQAAPKRKVLGLRIKREPDRDAPDTRYILPGQSVFMVWSPDGEMPKRIYLPEEQHIAVHHAQKLASETGRQFFVMRAWRGFAPKPSNG